MDTPEPADQVRSVLAEVAELLRTPNSQNLEAALPLLDDTKRLLREVPAQGDQGLPRLGRTLKDMGRLAEQTAAFYLGLAAAMVSRAGSYNSDGGAAPPPDCRRVSVDG